MIGEGWSTVNDFSVGQIDPPLVRLLVCPQRKSIKKKGNFECLMTFLFWAASGPQWASMSEL
jgi:hypothetical protein